ncbi:MAG: ABC transporter substrate-binding protein [Anaerolineaceae bacterium]
MKKYLMVVLVVSLFLISACNAQNVEPSGVPQKTEASQPVVDDNESEIVIAMVDKSSMHKFHRTLKSGAEKAAKELGITLVYDAPENATMVDKQLDMIDAAIAKKPSALAIAGLDQKAVVPAVERANSMDIPVICFDNGIASDIPVTTVATNDLAATAVLAEKLAEAMNGTGKIAILGHDQTSKNGIERRDGFKSAIEKNYPNIEIVDIQYAMDQLKATETAKAMLLAHSDLTGIYGTNESTVVGILNAVTELGLEGKILIVGYDSGKQQTEAIRSGLQLGAITQNPVGIGYNAVMSAYKAIKGEKLEKLVDAPFFYYTKDNIDDPDISACLYD